MQTIIGLFSNQQELEKGARLLQKEVENLEIVTEQQLEQFTSRPQTPLAPTPMAIEHATLLSAADYSEKSLTAMMELLQERGVAREEAEFYARAVSKGGSLLLAHTDDADKASRLRRILADGPSTRVS